MTFNMYQSDGVEPIAVLRPQLPSARQLLPYLERIDQSRVYSNWGPLTSELTDRLCAQFGSPPGSVICANSGTSALIGAILATAGQARREKPLAIVPDYTFSATALAAQMCGYEVVLASCSNDSWTFSAEDILASPRLLDRVGLVLPVAPFGRLLTQGPWKAFRERTAIPVVFDGAACFDLLPSSAVDAIGEIPLAISFHATKSFGVGEGGCVVTCDEPTAHRVLQCLNFGFLESRDTRIFGINGKMPEYTAAVGLAELDGWQSKHDSMIRMFRAYAEECSRVGVKQVLWGAPRVSFAYILLQCGCGEEASRIVNALEKENIATRFWYGNGLHAHTVFGNLARLDFHGAASLDPRTLIGLPVAHDLERRQIRRICSTIARAGSDARDKEGGQ